MRISLTHLTLCFAALGMVLSAGCADSDTTIERRTALPDLSDLEVVLVVAPENFRDEELLDPLKQLDRAGARTKIASSRLGTCTGMLGARIEAVATLDTLHPDALDGIVFVGGPGASVFWEDETAHSLISALHQQNKPVAAICLAPVTLARAGILDGIPATVWKSEQAELEAFGAVYTGRDIERHGSVITASGPQASTAFATELLDALSCYKKERRAGDSAAGK